MVWLIQRPLAFVLAFGIVTTCTVSTLASKAGTAKDRQDSDGRIVSESLDTGGYAWSSFAEPPAEVDDHPVAASEGPRGYYTLVQSMQAGGCYLFATTKTGTNLWAKGISNYAFALAGNSKTVVVASFVQPKRDEPKAIRLQKYSGSGDVLWKTDVEGFWQDAKLDVDKQGNVYFLSWIPTSHFYKLDASTGRVIWNKVPDFRASILRVDSQQNIWIAGGDKGPQRAAKTIMEKFSANGDQLGRLEHLPANTHSDFLGGLEFDGSGNIYLLCNSFSAESEMGSSSSTVVKYSPRGAILWSKGGMFANSMKVDASGRVTTAGGFVTRILPDGTVFWTKQLAGVTDSNGLAVDDKGRAFVARSPVEEYFGMHGGGRPPDYNPAFVGFAADGTELWRKSEPFKRSLFNAQTLLFDDSQGEIVCETSITKSSPAIVDTRIDRIQPNGTIMWSHDSKVNRSHVYAVQSATTASGDTFVIGGTGYPQGRYLDREKQIFVAKFDSSGKVSWDKAFNPIPVECKADGIAACRHGGVYVCSLGASREYTDALVRRYDEAGNELWTLKLPNDYVAGLQPRSDGSVWVCCAEHVLLVSEAGKILQRTNWAYDSYGSAQTFVPDTQEKASIYTERTVGSKLLYYHLTVDASGKLTSAAAKSYHPDAGSFFASGSGNLLSVSKRDPSGGVLWTANIPDPDSVPSKLIPDGHGGVFVGCTNNPSSPVSRAAHVYVLNASGQFEWRNGPPECRSGKIVFDIPGEEDWFEDLGLDGQGNLYLTTTSAGPDGFMTMHVAKYAVH